MESYLINRGDNSGAALENIDQGILSSQVPMEIPGINLLQISFLKGHFEFLNPPMNVSFVQITMTLKLSVKADLHCNEGCCLNIGFYGKYLFFN
jgi:hypothetical protein